MPLRKSYVDALGSLPPGKSTSSQPTGQQLGLRVVSRSESTARRPPASPQVYTAHSVLFDCDRQVYARAADMLPELMRPLLKEKSEARSQILRKHKEKQTELLADLAAEGKADSSTCKILENEHARVRKEMARVEGNFQRKLEGREAQLKAEAIERAHEGLRIRKKFQVSLCSVALGCLQSFEVRSSSPKCQLFKAALQGDLYVRPAGCLSVQGVWYGGVVSSRRTSIGKETLFKIEYDDGDEEEVDLTGPFWPTCFLFLSS